MFPFSSLPTQLRDCAMGPQSQLFDFYRLVDVVTHNVLSLPEGSTEPVESGETCHHIWGTEGPCANCTSRTCVMRSETIVKIMYLDGQALLIYSMPVVVGAKPYALELIKDVTSSLVVPSLEKRANLEIMEMIEEFNDLAVRDSFTGLFNKVYATNQLQIDLDNSLARGVGQAPAALIMFDVNDFKSVNDTYGHAVGDDVLLFVAKTLEAYAATLQNGWAARFGGDEFMVCAPLGMTADDERRLQDTLASLAKRTFSSPDGQFTTSLSYGIATVQEGDTTRSLIDRADDAMYAMKAEYKAAHVK